MTPETPMISFKISNANLAFLSDMLAGVKTPGALIAVGHFIGFFSKQILEYQNTLNDIAKEEHDKSVEVGKSFFETDDKGNAIKDENWQMKLLEGKLHEDFMAEYKKILDGTNERRIIAGNFELAIEIDANAFYRFKDEFYNNVDVELATRTLCKSQEEKENFIGILYNVMTIIDAVHA